ncbi:sensor histidine kinase [Undibacter mobilis]|uniref:histidine kinase n=1 Tax=Undibacter mobilis TaxID=2292256 RepID=A0A371BAF5_9BRAD|nr:sensor histidine kinase [Undibacter mobilis]RDV04599.1 sensor histidine kinase [Undibacter mobilis]
MLTADAARQLGITPVSVVHRTYRLGEVSHAYVRSLTGHLSEDLTEACNAISIAASWPVTRCHVISMYEKELRWHKATESKLREAVIRERALLHQKDAMIQQMDVLGKESEHRFLNGLQLITSLLTAQSRGTTDPEAAAQLMIAANRVATLARVHRHLHALDKTESVQFKPYLEELCHDIADMTANEIPRRSIRVEGDALRIPSVTAIPLGFIANELITNSIKYAKGNVTVDLKSTPEGNCVLSVSDDGPASPAPFDPMATPGLGMKIITALTRQIGGDFHFAKGDRDHGPRFSVTFKPQDMHS